VSRSTISFGSEAFELGIDARPNGRCKPHPLTSGCCNGRFVLLRFFEWRTFPLWLAPIIVLAGRRMMVAVAARRHGQVGTAGAAQQDRAGAPRGTDHAGPVLKPSILRFSLRFLV